MLDIREADGAVTDALVRFLARRLGRPASAFRLVRGASSRDKLLRLEGIAASAVRAALEASGPEARA